MLNRINAVEGSDTTVLNNILLLTTKNYLPFIIAAIILSACSLEFSINNLCVS
jgi:hypothetical protein